MRDLGGFGGGGGGGREYLIIVSCFFVVSVHTFLLHNVPVVLTSSYVGRACSCSVRYYAIKSCFTIECSQAI